MARINCDEFLKSQLFKDIKPSYYFFGAEPYLIEEAIRHLSQAAIGSNILGSKVNPFQAVKLYADQATAAQVMDEAHTLPFGAAKRVVLVRGAEAFSTDDLNAFIPYVENPQPSTLLIFWDTGEIDGRKKFFKAVDKWGCLVESEALVGAALHPWIRQLSGQKGHEIDGGAVESLADRVGGTLHGINQALEKISLYLGSGHRIDEAAIKTCLADTREGIVWQVTEALGQGRLPQAYLALKRMLREKDYSTPIQLIGALAGFYRRLLYIRAAQEAHIPEATLLKEARLSPGAVYMNRKLASQLTLEKLRRALQMLSRADRRLKTTSVGADLVLWELVWRLGALK